MKQSLTPIPALGQYRLVGTLGTGAYGLVYAGVDDSTGQKVAIKELVRTTPSTLSRFKREFRALQGLHHPNLVELRELLEEQGRWFIVMELVQGRDLVTHVRESDCANDNSGAENSRLRKAFMGFAEGLHALHAHGVAHRDLKPSNVLVDQDGRAVLLDFGLVTAVDPDLQSSHGVAAGTALYMAPEQATGQSGPAADWYSLGVCLYEALTGSVPFEGPNAVQVMIAKQDRLPAKPSTHCPGLPGDLERLCMQLLSPNPEERPTGEQVLRAFGAPDRDEDPLPHHVVPTNLSFAGRDQELASLAAALRETHNGALSLVLVEGESGVGKSALVHEFTRRAREQDGDTWILSGRCYENERVPYKAFDGCIEQLARHLRRLSRSDCLACMPRRAGVLTQLFPILSTVPDLQAAPMKGLAADPTARRLEAFSVLASLLSRLAEDRPLIVVIDDLHWADDESFRLLRALTEGVRPPILVVCTLRERYELSRAVELEVERISQWDCTEEINLRGLPASSAQQLARELLGAEAPESWLNNIAWESRGHPLFLAELVRFAATNRIDNSTSLTLDAALSSRVESLEAGPRQLLELVALAGRPHPAHHFAHALGVSDVNPWMRSLLAARLVRSRGANELICEHDRIRRVALDLIPASHRSALHRRLAEALTRAKGVDPGEVALHWDLAGDSRRALQAYERAADGCMQSLAFARAEQLYGRALDLLEEPGTERRASLLKRRGDSLAAAGHSSSAAELYQRAAQLHEGEERTRLRVLAAQHLIQSARVTEGMDAARQVLADVGAPLRGSVGALTRMAWDHAAVAVGGLELRQGRHPDTSNALSLRLHTLHALSVPVGWVQMLPGAAVNTRYLRAALSAGDPEHGARALAQRASFLAMQCPDRRDQYETVLARARELAGTDPPDDLKAYLDFMEGSTALFDLRVFDAERCLQSAHGRLMESVPDPWLLTNVRMTLGGTWHFAGKHRQLASQGKEWLREAEERNDAFAKATLLSLGCVYNAHLMSDDPDASRCALEEVMRAWPRTSFALVHLGELLTVLATELYRGGEGAWRWIEEHDEWLRSAYVLKMRFGKASYAELHASAAIAASLEAAGQERDKLLAAALRDARTLRSLKSHATVAQSLKLQAQVEILKGRPEAAVGLLRQALASFDNQGMAAECACTGYLLGLLEKDATGKARRMRALDFLTEQGWKQPMGALRRSVACLDAIDDGLGRDVRAPSRYIRGRYEPLDPVEKLGERPIRVRDIRSRRVSALKRISTTQPTALARFKQEFRVLQELHHPNLVRLEALFEYQSSWYVAMEHVAGQDLFQWCGTGRTLNQARLKAALSQVLAALEALHEAGVTHRAVTPGNVRVTPEGRVVLLDFGPLPRALCKEARLGEVSLDGMMTLPAEQIEGKDVDGRADIYAVGVCLYMALSGTAPFGAATAGGLLLAKQRGRPVPPSVLDPDLDIPRDLEDLCFDMLERDPSQRPPAADARSKLSALDMGPVFCATDAAMPSLTPGASAMQSEGIFSGRNEETERLLRAYAECSLGGQRVVVVQGESGVGKTSLVAHVLRLIQSHSPKPLILRSRCYENEQIPYKAFDAAVDELALALRRRSRRECEMLLPKRAALLAQLFPVLASVGAIADAPRKGLDADPAVRRRRAFVVLRKLLSKLARQQPIVVAIDDLQWSDAESFRLLTALFEPPGPALLCLATLRPQEELTAGTCERLRVLEERTHLTTLRLGGLPPRQAETLVASALGPEAPTSWIETIVEEGNGHPLFLREMAAYAQRESSSNLLGRLTLDEALTDRLRRLAPPERQLLQMVAVAGRPLFPHVLDRALDREDVFQPIVNRLLAERLLRARHDQALVCFHDRIRRVVHDSLSAKRRAELCAALALAFEAEPEEDAADRARLWDAAGDAARARDAYAEAARQAVATLAFDRAERLCARAIELTPEHEERWNGLTVEHGHALASLGRSAAAAHAFQSAAARSRGEQATRLRVLAAQHLLQSAQVEEGLRAAHDVLAEVGVPLPSSATAALRQLALERLRLAVRGLSVKPRPSEVIDRRERLMLDAILQLNFSIGWLEMMSGALLNSRYLRISLAAGDPGHTARALAQEASVLAMQKSEKRTTYVPLMTRAREIARLGASPELDAHLDFLEGSTHLFTHDIRSARSKLERAHETLCTHCPGEPWLLTNVRMTLGGALGNLGEYATLVRKTSEWIHDARERQDRFAEAALYGLGLGFYKHLLQDDPQTLRETMAHVMRPWPPEPVGLAHLGEIFGVMTATQYVGGRSGWEWLIERRQWLEGAFLLKTRFVASHFEHLRGVAALWALVECSDAESRQLLSVARKQVKKLDRSKDLSATAMCSWLRAQLALIDGDTEQALADANKASEQLRHVGQHSHADGAAYLAARIEGGSNGAERAQRMLAARRAWTRPDRSLYTCNPALAWAELKQRV